MGHLINTSRSARGPSDEAWGFIVAVGLNLIFLALSALLLWPLGVATLAYRLAKGFLIFWAVVFVATALLYKAQEFFRVNMYDHPDAYVNSNVALSGILQAGWAAFAALAVGGLAAGAPLWTASALHLAGMLSCLVAFSIVGAFYWGHVYKFINVAIAFVGFVVFSAWPAAARVTYGRLFDIF